MNVNGFPKKPYLAQTISQNTANAAMVTDSGPAQPEVFGQLCTACHQLGGKGGNVGPALDTIGQRMNKEELVMWLKDPAAVKPGTQMPNLGLADDKIEELSLYLSQKR